MKFGCVFCLVILMVTAFKIPLHRVDQTSRRLTSSGEIPIANSANVLFPQAQYYANITVGTPGQNVSAYFQTGTAWSWLASVSCDLSCVESSYYDSSLSTSYKAAAVTDNLQSSLGNFSGLISYDTITIGPNLNMTANSVPFILVTTEAGLTSPQYTGVIVTVTQGFGFTAQSPGYPTFVDTLKTQGAIAQRIFSFYFSNDGYSATGYDLNSACVIGEVDMSYAKGNVTYIPLYKQTGYWSVNLNSVTLGGTSVTLSTDTAILDTGTAQMTIPNTELHSLLNALNGAGSCTIDSSGNISCDCALVKQSAYPDLVLSLGANQFTLTSGDYLNNVCDRQVAGTCAFLGQGSTDSSYWVLGGTFLRRYYTIYDMDNARVGIASASGNTLVMVLTLVLASVFN